jgi:hypothetical protein
MALTTPSSSGGGSLELYTIFQISELSAFCARYNSISAVILSLNNISFPFRVSPPSSSSSTSSSSAVEPSSSVGTSTSSGSVSTRFLRALGIHALWIHALGPLCLHILSLLTGELWRRNNICCFKLCIFSWRHIEIVYRGWVD